MTTLDNPYYDRATRLLHLGLATTVTYQLFISLIMKHPRPGKPLQGMDTLIFASHEWVGLAAFIIVLLHALWSMAGPIPVRWRTMFPRRWRDWQESWQDLRTLLRLHIPSHSEHIGLSALVHGLGLLVVLGIAATGTVLFFFMPENGALTPRLRSDLHLHQFVATFVWIYWGGHVTLALLHQVLGHRVFAKVDPRKR